LSFPRDTSPLQTYLLKTAVPKFQVLSQKSEVVLFLHDRNKKDFLLVEPVAKTPYPPLGLMKISSMLRAKYSGATIHQQIGEQSPEDLVCPEQIYVTSLFTWDLKKVNSVICLLKNKYPGVQISVGGIAASLLPEVVYEQTGIKPNFGLLEDAECYPPDYSLSFGRKLRSSITFTTRGCIRTCNFCTVKTLEPEFKLRKNWQQDINVELPAITFWDNNWLASPNLGVDIDLIASYSKKVDFNQGLDARLYTEDIARHLAKVDIDPIRFAFDDISQENAILRAISIAKRYSKKEICVYVLYNYNDTPEDFYYKINLLNKEDVLSFPMGYRPPVNSIKVFPNPSWNVYLLRALKLSLLFYYRRGMITKSRDSFLKIYGNDSNEFISNLYRIYDYDKTLKRKEKDM
jgi:hypothetical protein